ncbi:MAG: MerR family DNA-binding protein [Acidobacteriota bacterium]
MNTRNQLTIGRLAAESGVNLETIRYYERLGLLPKPPRTASGYRRYTTDAVRRVRFIKQAQMLGFSLKEIAELLSLRVDPATTCADIKQKAERKIDDIEEKIRTLRRMKEALAKVSASCIGRGPTSECPILEALDASKEDYGNR